LTDFEGSQRLRSGGHSSGEALRLDLLDPNQISKMGT
jgi:hypothetical protein